MKRVALVIPLLAAFSAPTALADSKAVCLDAASKGQTLRDDHKLIEARQEFRTCARRECPAAVQSDCAGWLADVEKALPTVVLSAKDAGGADSLDVKVTIDGQPLASKLDGQATPVNPGPHLFHFESADGLSVDQRVIIAEGERSQRVKVVLAKAAPVPTASTEPTATTSTAPSSPSSPLRTLGWVAAGVGAAGLAVGTVFGIIAMSDKSSAHCDSNNVCDPGTTSGIRSAALVSDIGWIAGGVFMATGLGLLLFAPRGTHEAAQGVRLVPTVTASGAGALVQGRF